VEYSPPGEIPKDGEQRLLNRFRNGQITRSVNYLSTTADVQIAKEFTGVPFRLRRQIGRKW
jgi:hypothetical protein